LNHLFELCVRSVVCEVCLFALYSQELPFREQSSKMLNSFVASSKVSCYRLAPLSCQLLGTFSTGLACHNEKYEIRADFREKVLRLTPPLKVLRVTKKTQKSSGVCGQSRFPDTDTRGFGPQCPRLSTSFPSTHHLPFPSGMHA